MKIVTYSASLFLACYVSSAIANTSPLVLTSKDGKDWTVVHSAAFTDGAELMKLTQKGDALIAVGRNYNLTMVVKSDNKGETWTTVYPRVSAFMPVGISANNKEIALGGNSQYDAYINSSEDGYNWSAAFLPHSSDCQSLQKLTSFTANSSTILMSGSCLYFNKKNGTTYSRATLLASNNISAGVWQFINNLPEEMQLSGAAINFVQWIKDKWFVLATTATNKPVILTSTDMKSWSMLTVPDATKTLTSIAANDSEYIAIGRSVTDEPIAIRSVDQGKTWVIQTFLKDETFNQIRYAGNWVIVGKAGNKETRLLMLSSKNGTAWESIDLPAKVSISSSVSTLNDVIWTGEKWVAVGVYDSAKSGCSALKNLKWKGKLQAAQSIISVSDFNAWSEGNTQDNVTYDANASIDYTGNEDGHFSFGVFHGTCVEQDNGKTMNLNLTFNGRSINATFNPANNNAMTITSSCLPNEHENCLNFTGTLSVN